MYGDCEDGFAEKRRRRPRRDLTVYCPPNYEKDKGQKSGSEFWYSGAQLAGEPMEFDLEKARELFDSGQFATVTRGLGSTLNFLRQIQPRGRTCGECVRLHRPTFSRIATSEFRRQLGFFAVSRPAESRNSPLLLRKARRRIDDACARVSAGGASCKRGSRPLDSSLGRRLTSSGVLADGLLEPPSLTALLAEMCSKSVSSAEDPPLARVSPRLGCGYGGSTRSHF